MITAEKLHALGIGPEWVEPLNATIQKFSIFTVKEQAAFIGQCSHECNHFKTLEENLNYRAETLQKLFGHKFKPEEIALYAHNPEKIANRIYANRGGNRDEASGDGNRFHGRGCIQLTFHDNYWHCGQALGQDFVMNPQLVATPMWAAMSAGWFWSTHGCNQLAESGNEEGLCKRINGGLFGLDERIALTNKTFAVLSG
jgi:putative chitinase